VFFSDLKQQEKKTGCIRIVVIRSNFDLQQQIRNFVVNILTSGGVGSARMCITERGNS